MSSIERDCTSTLYKRRAVRRTQPRDDAYQRPRITSIPASTSSVFAAESLPARSARADLSRAMIWETFATESFGRPVILDVRSTLPGASAQRKLLVSGTQTVVAIRLRFKASP